MEKICVKSGRCSEGRFHSLIPATILQPLDGNLVWYEGVLVLGEVSQWANRAMPLALIYAIPRTN